ncbi:MAG: hypothetical protein KF883_06580 [Thermomicrobiales bacterium]|nr:hypothetical protein [Thermomicrobiales bacterium]
MDHDWSAMDPDGVLANAVTPPALPRVLILTPVKDAARWLPGYFSLLNKLTYPARLISLGMLESDSQDGTWKIASAHIERANRHFRRARIWKTDFDYRIPRGKARYADAIQADRRSILARSRNHLLFHALDDEEWVLWLDSDVVDFPPDLIERLLAAGRDIVQPHCVLDYGGPTFDRNGWRDRGALHLDDLRHEGTFAELHSVGGTVLWIRADLHRDGLIFPPFYYGQASQYARSAQGEIETEGLGMMALDMGYAMWGMPHLEVRHRRG